jgi:two-component system, OmpR family, sensor histidine kinase KdpD
MPASIWRDDVRRLAAALAAVAFVTAAYFVWLDVTNATTVALSYLFIVLIVATASRLWVAVATSLAAMLTFNFFFLPPVGTLVIADPQNWVALFAFLAVSLVASRLSTIARDRQHDALARRDEMARLFDLSRDVLLTTDSHKAINLLALFIAQRFELDYVAICLPRTGDGERWDVFDTGAQGLVLDRQQLAQALAGAQQGLEFDADTRTYSGHRQMAVGGRVVALVPLRLGTKAVGLLASSGRNVDPGTLDALGGVAAIAIERAQFLEERKVAELARQSEELKSALLTSLGHDLRTPLTAVRIAATNLLASWLSNEQRRDQIELILTENERLTRLFNNILEMARIDANAVATERQWVRPVDIIDAARGQVEHTLRSHRLDLQTDDRWLVRLDPRLTAGAVAHILENAAQYTPAGSRIQVRARVDGNTLTIEIRDQGPGLSVADLPHLFDRFYRGTHSKQRASGTGMGLSIARGLLALEQGRVWAENVPDGGAQFTVVIPAEARTTELAEPTHA